MIALTAGLLLVPVLDQLVKLALLRAVAPASVSLGPFGELHVIRSRIWWARAGAGANWLKIWVVWCFAAASLFVLASLLPSCGWFAGVLLGGSLSHALETSLRGCIIDYVRLRFWPAFNLADVAITVGAAGVLLTLAQSV